MVVAVGKGEIRTNGAEPTKAQNGEGEPGDLKQPRFSETAELSIDKDCRVKKNKILCKKKKEKKVKNCTQPWTNQVHCFLSTEYIQLLNGTAPVLKDKKEKRTLHLVLSAAAARYYGNRH